MMVSISSFSKLSVFGLLFENSPGCKRGDMVAGVEVDKELPEEDLNLRLLLLLQLFPFSRTEGSNLEVGDFFIGCCKNQRSDFEYVSGICGN